MIRVGRPGAERELGLKDWSTCSGSHNASRSQILQERS